MKIRTAPFLRFWPISSRFSGLYATLWVLFGLNFLLSSCQMPVNSVSSAAGTPSVRPQNRVPLSTYYSHGLDENNFVGLPEKGTDSLRAFLRKTKELIQPDSSNQELKIQDYAQSSSNENSNVNSLSATLSWPSAAIPPDDAQWYVGVPTGDSLSLGSSDLTPVYAGYSYGLTIREYGTDAKGNQIATKIGLGVAVNAKHSDPVLTTYDRGSWFYGSVEVVSTDGIHYTTVPGSAVDAGLNFFWALGNSGPYGCPPVVSGNSQNPMHVDSAVLTLNPHSSTGHIVVTISGSMTVETGYAYYCPHTSVTGNSSFTVDLDVNVAFGQTGQIQIEAEPAGLNAPLATSDVTVTPTLLTEPWTVKVVSENVEADGVENTCKEPDVSGLGVMHQDFPFDPNQMTNGKYTLTAQYADPIFGASASTEILVDMPAQFLTPKNNVVFRPLDGEALVFKVLKGACPAKWNLHLSGAVLDPLSGLPGNHCDKDLEGSDSPIIWNGDCDGGKATGVWQATLKWLDKDAQINVIAETAPRNPPFPNPGATACPDPASCLNLCEEGVLCVPLPGPSAGGSPSPSPSPSPEVSPSASPGPSQSPGASPSPTPTPTATDTPTPTPTPAHVQKLLVQPFVELESTRGFTTQEIKVMGNGDVFDQGTDDIALIGATYKPDPPLLANEQLYVHGEVRLKNVKNGKFVAFSQPFSVLLKSGNPELIWQFRWLGRDMNVANSYYLFATRYWIDLLDAINHDYATTTSSSYDSLITGPFFVEPGEYEIVAAATTTAKVVNLTNVKFNVDIFSKHYVDAPDYKTIPKKISDGDVAHILTRHHPLFLSEKQMKNFDDQFKSYIKNANRIKQKLDDNIRKAKNNQDIESAYNRASLDIQSFISSTMLEQMLQEGASSDTAKGTCVAPNFDALKMLDEIGSIANFEGIDTIDTGKGNVTDIRGTRTYDYTVLVKPHSTEIVTAYPNAATPGSPFGILHGMDTLNYYFSVADPSFGKSRNPFDRNDLAYLLSGFKPTVKNLKDYLYPKP